MLYYKGPVLDMEVCNKQDGSIVITGMNWTGGEDLELKAIVCIEEKLIDVLSKNVMRALRVWLVSVILTIMSCNIMTLEGLVDVKREGFNAVVWMFVIFGFFFDAASIFLIENSDIPAKHMICLLAGHVVGAVYFYMSWEMNFLSQSDAVIHYLIRMTIFIFSFCFGIWLSGKCGNLAVNKIIKRIKDVKHGYGKKAD